MRTAKTTGELADENILADIESARPYIVYGPNGGRFLRGRQIGDHESVEHAKAVQTAPVLARLAAYQADREAWDSDPGAAREVYLAECARKAAACA